MNNIEGKIKRWIANISTKNKKLNGQIFKLLLYLSHTADKCNKQNHATGKEIYKLTCLLCSILTKIPDNIKFVSSLFHIIRCLLAMCMFNEAYKICLNLKTEALYCSHENVSDILVKIAFLWCNTINNKFLILQKDPSGSKHYYELKNIIKYELEMIQIAYKNSTKHLLMKISLYLDKIALMCKEPNICFVNFSTFIIEYLNETKILLNKDEKYIICRHMLHITSRIMCENINEKCLKSAIQIFNTISDYFKKILLEDEECYQCFLLCESLCLTVAKPVECLVESNVKSIQDLNDSYVKLTKQYGYTGAIKWTTFSILQILEPLFIYWETCIKATKKIYLKDDLLLETMNLVRCISTCFSKQTLEKCKSCQSENCNMRKDTYNAVVIKTRCINLISKLSANDLSKSIIILVRKFLEQNIVFIYEMKECNCKCWTHLWRTNGALIYNLGIMSDCFYEESVSLFSLLFTSIIQFEGIQSRCQYISLQNPVSLTLHRISSLHYNHGMYREAMTATALNALLSYNDSESKAFRMWANIKYKSATKEIMEMTILTCLKRDRLKMEELGLSIELSKYDLVQICLREAKSLQEAKVNLSAAIHEVLNDLKTLKASPVEYARVVQMLAHHLSNFDYNEDISEYLKRAMLNLKQLTPNASTLCLQANLEFYMYITQLHTMNQKTQIEMENTKFALYAPKINEIGENESCDVVPAYSMINVKVDSRLMMYLEIPLKKWNKCLKQNLSEVAKGYEPMITLHTLIIAGEYAHLYRYEEYEITIWKLAHTLASEMQNNFAIIYVIGRSISLRYVNDEWISTAKELAIKHKDTNDDETIYAIAIFWISLSDFYFECNMYDEARKLLDESRQLPRISFFSNIAVYLYSLDRILYNCYLYKETIKHEEYTRYIVETLYTIVNLNEELASRKWKYQDKHLFGFDILLSATVNLSFRMNSLLSFREIGAHLVRRLKTAQTLGATIRVAEILKSLCYIDLSRAQLSDCEVKLQGLEHILNIETLTKSMNNNCTKINSENIFVSPIRNIDPIRDVPQNDSSPVLRNKVFDLPKFMCHKNCDCYICQNVAYHYLVFASTHIRAQLYALQKNISASLQHFYGAFKIKENLMKKEKYIAKCNNEYFSWQERFYTIDYILLLINFSYFLRSYLDTSQEKIMSIILLAAQICDMNKLKGHPIYIAVKELIIDCRFRKIFDISDHSKFTVPNSSDINISKYVQEYKVEGSICVTPTTNNTRVKKPITLRRNRTPPLLKLTKVSMAFSDDEDNTPSPPSRYKKTRSSSRLTRRRLLNDEYSDTISQTKQETKQLKNNLSLEGDKNISIKDIIEKVESLAPGISEHLYKVVDKKDEAATTKNVQKLIHTIENLKQSATSQKSARKTRNSKPLISNDYNNINQVIALFQDFGIDEKKNNLDPLNKNDAISGHSKDCMSSVKTDSLSCQKQDRISEESNIENLEQNNYRENTRLRITKNSTNSVKNKQMHNIKTRKSKEKL
ncbi:hypothetical protein WH47_09843 [Habropoda laboriosa]|uniref:Uncharacterized protein n=1 Tax=Habropoda laboriosa TaxID=597456 RepID=A0A0L7R364_9HYME|nr:hypothetical protein WH47_09843 [Habropoda laboriosa]